MEAIKKTWHWYVASGTGVPGYWRHETGGELALAMRRYIEDEELTVRDVQLIRAYLRQWIDAEAWDVNPYQTQDGKRELNELRRTARAVNDRPSIDRWVHRAVEFGADPL